MRRCPTKTKLKFPTLICSLLVTVALSSVSGMDYKNRVEEILALQNRVEDIEAQYDSIAAIIQAIQNGFNLENKEKKDNSAFLRNLAGLERREKALCLKGMDVEARLNELKKRNDFDNTWPEACYVKVRHLALFNQSWIDIASGGNLEVNFDGDITFTATYGKSFSIKSSDISECIVESNNNNNINKVIIMSYWRPNLLSPKTDHKIRHDIEVNKADDMILLRQIIAYKAVPEIRKQLVVDVDANGNAAI